MSIDYCNYCEQVVEGDTIKFRCAHGDDYLICRRCEEDNVIQIPEDDPRRDR